MITAQAMPRIWTLMDDDQRVRMYRLAAEGKADTAVLHAVGEDIRQQLEIRDREVPSE